MEIAIEGQIFYDQRTGIGHYTFNILKHLLEVDKKNSYDLILFPFLSGGKKFFLGKKENLNYRFVKYLPFRLYRKLFTLGFGLSLDLLAGRHDLYFFPNFQSFPVQAGYKVAMIHDLGFIRFPSFAANQKSIQYLRKVTEESVKGADRLVVISEFTKKELIDNYEVNPRKIEVIYPGLDREVFSLKRESRSGLKKFGIKRPYILFLGMLEPRKNIAGLIKAFAGMPSHKNYQLVIAGGRGWKFEEIFKVVDKLNLKDDVIFTGYVTDQERPQLLHGASLFVYPSFYEGFGMPVVEAQACGVPVITSNTSSLPEAAGEGAIFIDPNNVGEISSAMQKVLTSKSLREELIKKGLQNAQKYSWEKSARKLLNLFNSLG